MAGRRTRSTGWRARVATGLAVGVLLPVAGHSWAAGPSGAAATETYPGQVAETSLAMTRYGDRVKIDLCYPANAEGERVDKRFPVIVELSYTTAGDHDKLCTGNFAEYVKHGYVAGFVNTPGTGGTEAGPFNPTDPAWQDRVYDAVEWLGAQKWSTGKVGTIGGSGNGLTQWFTSMRKPPALKTMIPIVAPANSWTSNMPGGMPSLQIGALGCAIPGVVTHARWGVWAPTDAEQAAQVAKITGDKASYGRIMPFCPVTGDWMAHPTQDSFWRDRMDAKMETRTLPVWVWGNWNDLLLTSSEESYLRLGSKDKMFTSGLSNHTAPGPGFDPVKESLRWFDHHLKGIDTGIAKDLKDRRFRYLVNQSFEWREARDYPVPGTRYTPFHVGGASSSPLGTGGLSPAAPTEPLAAAYVHSPAKGAQTGFMHDMVRARTANSSETDDLLAYNDPTGSTDQRLALGPDAVAFVSEPTEKGVELTGPVAATLFASTTAADTDFVVKLVDVFPDEAGKVQPGYWNQITFGNLKGTFRTFRDGYVKQTPIPAGEVVKYEVELRPTSYWLEKGHRLAVIVTSADAPRLMPNRNPAQVTVHSSPETPSSVTLPVVPRD